MQAAGNGPALETFDFVQAADFRPERDFHEDLYGWVRGRGSGQVAEDLAEGGQTAAATLERGGGQGEHLRQRRPVGHKVRRHQLVAGTDHDRFGHPQAQGDRGLAVKRQAVLVAHGGQKEIQHDRLVGQTRRVLPQKTTVNPRPTVRRRAAHAVGKKDLFVDHGGSPPENP